MTVKEISDYIINKYPECCLAYNIKNHLYSDEQLEKECINFFWYEKLNFCGCGTPNAVKKCIRDYLNIINDVKNEDYSYSEQAKRMKERFGFEAVYDNELLMCFAYTLDVAEFTEHGTAINACWLTEEGKMFLFLLNRLDFE